MTVGLSHDSSLVFVLIVDRKSKPMNAIFWRGGGWWGWGGRRERVETERAAHFDQECTIGAYVAACGHMGLTLYT